ncbi:hypothetical protein [Bosea vaviloviae]|uniref:Uncharacterized protein n=1 Tax=Bosea vaviloviae TaxID=1526658 RepID=A0A1D7U5S9_9HYPH|nr:hypothetical protein [Bosea vaviloviae]AOO82694.1 hypothetical protein BHK69_21610 [Bosea vaviloviae]
MAKSAILPLILIMPGVFTGLAKPLTALGDSYGPGWAELLNGGLGFVFIIAAAIAAITGRSKARPRG